MAFTYLRVLVIPLSPSTHIIYITNQIENSDSHTGAKCVRFQLHTFLGVHKLPNYFGKANQDYLNVSSRT